MENASIKNLLEKQSSCAFVPKGVSMWPFLKNRKQTVIIKKIDRPIKIYDVIFYTNPNGREVLHRVIGFNGEDFIVSGDGVIETEIVNNDSIFGVMQCFYKGKKLIPTTSEKHLKKVDNGIVILKKDNEKLNALSLD